MNQFSDLNKYYLMPYPCIGHVQFIYYNRKSENQSKSYFYMVKGVYNGYVFSSQMLLGMFGKVPNDSIFQGDENR